MQKTEKSKADRYSKIRLLGEGSFGKAYLVKSERTNGYLVIKEINISGLGEEEIKQTLKEAKILEGLAHPYIVSFREIYKTKKHNLCIVMEYADGDLVVSSSNLSRWGLAAEDP